MNWFRESAENPNNLRVIETARTVEEINEAAARGLIYQGLELHGRRLYSGRQKWRSYSAT